MATARAPDLQAESPRSASTRQAPQASKGWSDLMLHHTPTVLWRAHCGGHSGVMEGEVCYSRAESCKTELGKAAAPAGHSTTYCSRDRHRAQRASALLCCPSDTFQNPRVHVLSTFRSGKALNAACMEAQRPGPNAEPERVYIRWRRSVDPHSCMHPFSGPTGTWHARVCAWSRGRGA